MKKLLGIIILILLAHAPTSAYAAVGDAVGAIYSTDILAVVNGVPMQSYNIGGRTAVIAEELSAGMYGFNHTYNDNERTLYLQSGFNTNAGNVIVERGEVGEIIGNIYETDIKVIFNGREIPGYNIGGRTAVVIEDLGTMDNSSPNEQYGYSKYLCNFTWDNGTRTVTLNSFTSNYSYDKLLHYITYTLSDNVITAAYLPDNMYASGMNVSLSEEAYKNKLYQIEPLYLRINGSSTEVGLMYPYLTDENNLECCTYIDFETLNSLTASLKPSELIPYSETMSRFENAEEYSILSRCETENYTVMFVQFKNKPSDADDVHLVSVRRAGGYVTMTAVSSEYYTVFKTEKTGFDKVKASYGPTAGPHGEKVNFNTEFDLNMFQY